MPANRSRTQVRFMPAEIVWVGVIVGGAILMGISASLPSTPPTTASQGRDLVSFGRDVRPIIVRSCLVCHGFDPSTREAELRLDTFEHATAPRGRRGNRAISPGDPDASLMLDRVSSDDPEFRMPPEGEPLNEAEIETVRAWIEQGAQYETHWSLVPVEVVEPPRSADPEWDSNPIDRFVYDRFTDAGVTPGDEADRRALIRRLSFDLTGLPPTSERAKAFTIDISPDAYERLVDELLASPRFGERWARHWLDLMRYAETYAHEFDYAIVNAWKYRDYVIRAFNADVPYDEFVTEHVAGDLMENPRRHPDTGTNESILGTGFWWLSQGTHGPVDVRGDEAERIDNQIDVFSKAFLATTVSCARCHDHKFDPILQSEYYGLAGFIQSSRRQQAYLDPGRKITGIVDQLVEVRQHVAHQMSVQDVGTLDQRISMHLRGVGEVLGEMPQRSEAQTEGEDEPPRLRSRERSVGEVADELGLDQAELERWVGVFEPLDPASENGAMTPWVRAEAGLTPRAQPETQEGSRHVAFELFDDESSISRWTRSGWAFGERLAVPLTWRAPGEIDEMSDSGAIDSGLISKSLVGTARSETFEITEPYVWVRARGLGGVVRVIVDGFTMDEYNALLFESCKVNIDHDDWRWRRHDLSKYVGHRAHYEIIDDTADGFIAVDEIAFTDSEQPPSREESERLGAVAFDSVQDACDEMGHHVRQTLEGEVPGPGIGIANWLFRHGLMSSEPRRVGRLRGQFEKLINALPPSVRGLAMEDGTGEDERLFVRGNHKELGEVSPRGFLSALTADPIFEIPSGSGREQLAASVVDTSNPMTSRVMVNRVWHHLLGRGIVETTDDFGLLGASPSHPELLDHLADRFSGELGWSVKELIREIVTSRVYRGASEAMSEETRQIDPRNVLLSVRTPKRLDGESIRDAVLAVSGRLDLTMHGPGVKTHLSEFMTGRGKPSESGPADGDGRRSVYLEVRRNFLDPMMQAFDSPNPHSTMGKRSKSNVPSQSLILMNSELVTQQAGVLADRVMRESDVREDQLVRLYRLAIGRDPTPTERAAALGFLDSQGEALQGEGHENPERQALADLCHVVYNLKEFSFVE